MSAESRLVGKSRVWGVRSLANQKQAAPRTHRNRWERPCRPSGLTYTCLKKPLRSLKTPLACLTLLDNLCCRLTGRLGSSLLPDCVALRPLYICWVVVEVRIEIKRAAVLHHLAVWRLRARSSTYS